MENNEKGPQGFDETRWTKDVKDAEAAFAGAQDIETFMVESDKLDTLEKEYDSASLASPAKELLKASLEDASAKREERANELAKDIDLKKLESAVGAFEQTKDKGAFAGEIGSADAALLKIAFAEKFMKASGLDELKGKLEKIREDEAKEQAKADLFAKYDHLEERLDAKNSKALVEDFLKGSTANELDDLRKEFGKKAVTKKFKFTKLSDAEKERLILLLTDGKIADEDRAAVGALAESLSLSIDKAELQKVLAEKQAAEGKPEEENEKNKNKNKKEQDPKAKFEKLLRDRFEGKNPKQLNEWYLASLSSASLNDIEKIFNADKSRGAVDRYFDNLNEQEKAAFRKAVTGNENLSEEEQKAFDEKADGRPFSISRQDFEKKKGEPSIFTFVDSLRTLADEFAKEAQQQLIKERTKNAEAAAKGSMTSEELAQYTKTLERIIVDKNTAIAGMNEANGIVMTELSMNAFVNQFKDIGADRTGTPQQYDCLLKMATCAEKGAINMAMRASSEEMARLSPREAANVGRFAQAAVQPWDIWHRSEKDSPAVRDLKEQVWWSPATVYKTFDAPVEKYKLNKLMRIKDERLIEWLKRRDNEAVLKELLSYFNETKDSYGEIIRSEHFIETNLVGNKGTVIAAWRDQGGRSHKIEFNVDFKGYKRDEGLLASAWTNKHSHQKESVSITCSRQEGTGLTSRAVEAQVLPITPAAAPEGNTTTGGGETTPAPEAGEARMGEAAECTDEEWEAAYPGFDAKEMPDDAEDELRQYVDQTREDILTYIDKRFGRSDLSLNQHLQDAKASVLTDYADIFAKDASGNYRYDFLRHELVRTACRIVKREIIQGLNKREVVCWGYEQSENKTHRLARFSDYLATFTSRQLGLYENSQHFLEGKPQNDRGDAQNYMMIFLVELAANMAEKLKGRSDLAVHGRILGEGRSATAERDSVLRHLQTGMFASDPRYLDVIKDLYDQNGFSSLDALEQVGETPDAVIALADKFQLREAVKLMNDYRNNQEVLVDYGEKKQI